MAGRVDHELAGFLFALMGLCYERLGRYEKALEEYKLALQRTPEPTPLRADILGNRGVALVYLGRYRDGATSLIEAARIPGGDQLAHLSNLAEALDRLGDREAALQVFQEALEAADLTQPRDCFRMAHQAAELGLDAEAVELFARFVARRTGLDVRERAAVEVIRAAKDEDKGTLKERPALDAAVRRAIAMTDELARLARLGPETNAPNEGATAEALDVYEATRHLREEALAHIAETDGRGQA